MRIWLLVAAAAATSLVFAAPGWTRDRAPAADCTTPLTYDVVQVDPRHGVSRQELVALLRRSERLWEIPYGRDLLRYAPGGTVRVRLVYDDRQVTHDELTAAAAAAARGRSALAVEKAARKQESAEIARQRARYAARIAYWNDRGGAPEDVYSELQDERAAFNALVRTFNAHTSVYNRFLAQFNRQVSAYNALARSRVATDEVLGKVEVGGTAVEIAVLSGTARDDVLVAHEFGHILGIRHLGGAGNIMNPQPVRPLSAASRADLAALRAACAAGGG